MLIKKISMALFALGCTTALTGCITTQKMSDGTTKIRFTDETASSLVSMMPTSVVPMLSGTSSNTLDLNPTLSSIGTGEWLYLNGRFDYECMSAMLYSAKSGAAIDSETNETCRDRYFLRQQQLKRAGKNYDRGAPTFNPSSPPALYWQSVSGKTISQLASMSQFNTRFEGLPRIDSEGRVSIKVGFLGAAKGQDIRLTTVPERTLVVMDDATFEASMKSRSAQLKTDVGEMSACNANLSVANAVDKGRRPANIPASEFSRYEIRFTVISMGCKNSVHEFKSANGTIAGA